MDFVAAGNLGVVAAAIDSHVDREDNISHFEPSAVGRTGTHESVARANAGCRSLRLDFAPRIIDRQELGS